MASKIKAEQRTSLEQLTAVLQDGVDKGFLVKKDTFSLSEQALTYNCGDESRSVLAPLLDNFDAMDQLNNIYTEAI